MLGAPASLKILLICNFNKSLTSPNSCLANLYASSIVISPFLASVLSDFKNLKNPISSTSFVSVEVVHPDNLQGVESIHLV